MLARHFGLVTLAAVLIGVVVALAASSPATPGDGIGERLRALERFERERACANGPIGCAGPARSDFAARA